MDLENMSTDWLEAGAPPELISYAGRQGRTCLELGPKRRYAAVSLAEAMLDARPKLFTVHCSPLTAYHLPLSRRAPKTSPKTCQKVPSGQVS